MSPHIQRGTPRLVLPASVPSPASPSTVPLSSSDTSMPVVHLEALYAFAGAPHSTPISVRLEQGLRLVLCHYREWAGRIVYLPKSATTVDVRRFRPVILLDDSGVYFVEAIADFPLLQLSPSIRRLHCNSSSHLTDDPTTSSSSSCGGWTLGIAWDHHVADGEALLGQFMNEWRRAVKGLPAQVVPLHHRTAMMPRDPPRPQFHHIEFDFPPPHLNTSNSSIMAVDKFHFSLKLLNRIKAAAAAADGRNIYSTFVSLTAYLWRCITEARGLMNSTNADGNRSMETRALLVANLRKRNDPPLPKAFFGNSVSFACTHTTARSLPNRPLSLVAQSIQSAIMSPSNSDYIRSALDAMEIGRRNLKEERINWTDTKVLAPDIGVTTWVTLPLYELDFGYGTPVFARWPNIYIEGFMVLNRAPERDGSIDVVLGLLEADMQRFRSLCYNLI